MLILGGDHTEAEPRRARQASAAPRPALGAGLPGPAGTPPGIR